MSRRQGSSGLLKYAVSGAAGVIGLASESIHVHKEKKKATTNATISDSSTLTTMSQDEYVSRTEDIVIEQQDEKQWDLDEAQQGLPDGTYSEEEPPSYSAIAPSVPQISTLEGANITEAFLKRYPKPARNEENKPLSLPVILPQRRPKDRTRGFIRAYAPELEIKGIDQAMFLDFLQTFEKASGASPWINAVNLAGIATTFIPDGFGVGLAVGIAIQMSVKVAMELQSRSRTNAFLDKMNDEFFRPRGLFCLVMTWSPESSETSYAIDLTSTISAKPNPNSSAPPTFLKKFSSSSGKSYADMEFPEVAPLVYPALDQLADQQGEEAVTKRDKVKKQAAFVTDYWDKRAQAKYISKHPDSVLAQTPKPTFTSRYADPSHPASSGSLISLVTGGRINIEPTQQRGLLGGGLGSLLVKGVEGNRAYGGRGGLARTLGTTFLNQGERNDRSKHEVESRDDLDRNSGGGIDTLSRVRGDVRTRGDLGLGHGPLGLPLPTPRMAIKKLLKKDVLYLMIVNMPSEAQMVATMAATEERGHQKT